MDDELNPYVGLSNTPSADELNPYVGLSPIPGVDFDPEAPGRTVDPITQDPTPGVDFDPEAPGASVGSGTTQANKDAADVRTLIRKMLVNTDGSINLGGLAGMGGLLALLNRGTGGSQPVGYQGTIPNYAAVRERVPIAADPNRRSGAGEIGRAHV